MRTFAIGDIHGCYDELVDLMQKLKDEAKLNPKKDTVVFLGDYTDRGPKSKQVVSKLMQWEKRYPHWKFLYGNHEDLMLDALLYGGKIYHDFDLWYGQGGLQTAQSYLPRGFSKYDIAISQPAEHVKTKHLKWLSERPIYWENDEYFFVHGGIPVQTSLQDIRDNADNWDMRYSLIWARYEFIYSVKDWEKKIVFGHTPQSDFKPWVMDNKIGIDTGICPPGNGDLTAVELPAEKFYSVPALQRLTEWH